MALTAGSYIVNSQAQISGATIAPQGNASPNGLASPEAEALSTGGLSLAFGTGTDQADILCAGQFSIAGGGGTLTIDLYAGTDLKDVFGGTAAVRTLKAVHIDIDSGGDTTGVTIGSAGANPHPLFFSATNDRWTVFPGGPPLSGGGGAGVAVTNTVKNVLITNNGAVAVVVDVFVAGTSV